MKKLALSTLVVLLAGCSATQSVVTEYNSNGKISRVTVSKTSLINELAAATKDKTVIAWESGWAAYLSASTATTQDPTPHLKMFAGKSDKGMISALPNQQWNKLPEIINATKYNLTISGNGISTTK